MFGTKRCDLCWYVESYLPNYLKSPGAWAFIRKHIPLLDDWADGKPDAWDFEKVLADNNVTVEWCDKLIDGEGTVSQAPPDLCGWGFSWKHGSIFMGVCVEKVACKAAALFISLWQRGVTASFCDTLMDGYVCHLELQENTRLTFLAEIDACPDSRPYFRLTREGLLPVRDAFTNVEWKILEALGAPADDEEIIVTFTKRKKQ